MDDFEKADELKRKRREAEQAHQAQMATTLSAFEEAERRAREREASDREEGVSRSAQASSCCQARVLHTAENDHICTACGKFDG